MNVQLAGTINNITLPQLLTTNDLARGLATLRFELLKYIFTAMATQTALLVTLFELLK